MRKKALEMALVICFEVFFGHSSMANATKTPNVTSFELVNGLVIVEAVLDGNKANFILDTGSPMMVLNERNTTPTEFKAKNLHGVMAGNLREICEFVLAGVQKFELQAFTTDMSALEQLTKRSIAGLIGYDFLENENLVFDFKEQTVSLIPFDDNKQPDGWILKSEVPFNLVGHLPVIEVKIDEKTFRFGLDTGTSANLLSMQKSEDLLSFSPNQLSDGASVGIGGTPVKTKVASIPETEIDGLVFRDMRFLLSDISQLPNLKENNVDGLLGFPFFKEGKFTLDYSKQTFSIWE